MMYSAAGLCIAEDSIPDCHLASQSIFRMAICRLATKEGLQEDCWRVLDQCIQRLEADVHQERLLEASVQHMMDVILSRVSRDPSTHAEVNQAHSLFSGRNTVMLRRWSVVLKRRQKQGRLVTMPRSQLARRKVRSAATL